MPYDYRHSVVTGGGTPDMLLASNPDRVSLLVMIDGGFAQLYMGNPSSNGVRIDTVHGADQPKNFRECDIGSSIYGELWSITGFGDTMFAVEVFRV